MTSITIPEAILSQIKPGEQAVEVRDAIGRRIFFVISNPTAIDDLQRR